MPKKYYIAYGSNLNVNQMHFRCPGARVIGVATLDGWQLLFKGSKTGSYLTIEQNEGYQVPVAVWEITPEDEAALDRYEGYPTFYYKREIPVSFAGIKTGKVRHRTAMVYIMHEDRPLGIPTRSYLYTCAEGYRTFGFDVEYLQQAVADSQEVNDDE